MEKDYLYLTEHRYTDGGGGGGGGCPRGTMPRTVRGDQFFRYGGTTLSGGGGDHIWYEKCTRLADTNYMSSRGSQREGLSPH